jgi:hypothetical protein
MLKPMHVAAVNAPVNIDFLAGPARDAPVIRWIAEPLAAKRAAGGSDSYFFAASRMASLAPPTAF